MKVTWQLLRLQSVRLELQHAPTAPAASILSASLLLLPLVVVLGVRLQLQHALTAPAASILSASLLLLRLVVVHVLLPYLLQVVAAQALSAARAATEDLAPTPALSSSLCIQLATTLHTYVSDVMLATPADAEGSAHTSILKVNTGRGHVQR
jgi:hypothetical protein